LKDYSELLSIRERIDAVRSTWAQLPKEYLPPGIPDFEPIFKYILDRVPVPEVSYRADALTWHGHDGTRPWRRPRKGSEYLSLPDPSSGSANGILWLWGLSVEGPIGKKATWKVVVSKYDSYCLYAVLDRFGLRSARAHEILDAIARTPDGEIRRYPTAEAAKEAVESALLKIGLVGPIVEPEEMYRETGYDA
jgi:hypothetical protein